MAVLVVVACHFAIAPYTMKTIIYAKTALDRGCFLATNQKQKADKTQPKRPQANRHSTYQMLSGLFVTDGLVFLNQSSLADMPPSAIMGLPVTKDALSDNRNMAACAISSGSAMRLTGCKLAIKS